LIVQELFFSAKFVFFGQTLRRSSPCSFPFPSSPCFLRFFIRCFGCSSTFRSLGVFDLVCLVHAHNVPRHQQVPSLIFSPFSSLSPPTVGCNLPPLQIPHRPGPSILFPPCSICPLSFQGCLSFGSTWFDNLECPATSPVVFSYEHVGDFLFPHSFFLGVCWPAGPGPPVFPFLAEVFLLRMLPFDSVGVVTLNPLPLVVFFPFIRMSPSLFHGLASVSSQQLLLGGGSLFFEVTNAVPDGS